MLADIFFALWQASFLVTIFLIWLNWHRSLRLESGVMILYLIIVGSVGFVWFFIAIKMVRFIGIRWRKWMDNIAIRW